MNNNLPTQSPHGADTVSIAYAYPIDSLCIPYRYKEKEKEKKKDTEKNKENEKKKKKKNLKVRSSKALQVQLSAGSAFDRHCLAFEGVGLRNVSASIGGFA